MDEDEDGYLDPSEKMEIINFLSIHPFNQFNETANTFHVALPDRSADNMRTLKQAGYATPLHTNYTLHSTEGYAYVDGKETPWGAPLWPRFGKNDGKAFCDLPISCFGSETEPSQDLFKRVAFGERKCGDCLILALLNLSGRQGFSAFLPPSRQEPSPETVPAVIKTLPKTKTWQEADFSLETIASQLDNESYQTFCMRLIHRYSYVMADTPFEFVRMSNRRLLDFQLRRLSSKALLALNDDITSTVNDVDARLQEWFDETWPEGGEWELKS